MVLHTDRSVLDCLGECIAQCRRRAEPIALLQLDVDGLHHYTLMHGQLAACGLLRAVHDVLSDLMRPGDLRTRFGDPQVLVALPGRRLGEAREFAERARLRLAALRLDATVSIGITCADGDGFAGPQDMVHAVEYLVFRAKQHGGGHTVASMLAPMPA
jgi:diguanylate cyclase (GGDEF)-like protein